MKIDDYPSYIDEKFRIDFVKNAKERVCWISPKFSKDEMEAVNEIKNQLPRNCVNTYEYKKSTLSDRGHCFSLEDEHSCINIQLFINNKDIIYDSLLVVDFIACSYNYENIDGLQNAIFLDNINEVKLSELEKEIQNNQIIQISLVENEHAFGRKELNKIFIENSNLHNTDINGELPDKVIITTDIELKMIQDRICKVTINTPGIRTKDRNIDISNVLDIVGKPTQDIEDRLVMRWKIFGNDYIIDKEYKKLHNDLEKIKDIYTITINPYGRFILEKNKPEFELAISRFKEKLKHEAINIIEQKIDDSKLILKDLIITCYKFAKLNEEELKTCTEMELENIIANLKVRFPTVGDITEKCDVVYEYPSIEKTDILNKEFCRRLLIIIRDTEQELADILEKIIKS